MNKLCINKECRYWDDRGIETKCDVICKTALHMCKFYQPAKNYLDMMHVDLMARIMNLSVDGHIKDVLTHTSDILAEIIKRLPEEK